LKENTTIRVLVKNCTAETIERGLKPAKLNAHVRLWTDGESIIVRLIPSGRHDLTAGTIVSDIIFKITALPGHNNRSILSLASTRFTYNGRSKEADGAIKPDARGGLTNIP
jgi:hypothetical protein